MMMEMKRQKTFERVRIEERDRISELPDCVLLHIMKFMGTKYAVQTCVLSKRWKDLWKRLTHLTFHSSLFRTFAKFTKFVSQVLSSRDDSISLLNLDFIRRGWVNPKHLNRVVKYAVLHNVQQLRIDVILGFSKDFKYFPYIFSCPSLTFLKLSLSFSDTSMRKLPKSLHLPALKNLHLEGVSFTATDSDCAEPFSLCKMLNTLVLEGCFLHYDAKVLSISNSNLLSLTINGGHFPGGYRIALCTPNLSSFSVIKYHNLQLTSTGNLSLLEEVVIDTIQNTDFAIMSLLQVIPNVKIITLSTSAIQIILRDLSNRGSMRTQPPCFVKLESLKIRWSPSGYYGHVVNKLVEFLFQQSPLARVEVIP